MLSAQEEIPTMLIGPRREEFKIVLRQWDMPKNTGKNEVRLSNELEEHDVVQVWSFRLGQQSSDNASSSSSSSQERESLRFSLMLEHIGDMLEHMHDMF
ncbi:hypothetical protein CFP56_011460 [Quercus suber]|uniref:Uncharacterized protein n=1 Tax=Quercus suber TaxID=58331 RepID=A0AAW0M5M2_QUESU